MWEQFFSSEIFWVSFSSISCLGPIKLVSFLQSGLQVSNHPINFLQISLTSCRCWDYRADLGCQALLLATQRRLLSMQSCFLHIALEMQQVLSCGKLSISQGKIYMWLICLFLIDIRNHILWIIIGICYLTCLVLLLILRCLLDRENKRRDVKMLRLGMSHMMMYILSGKIAMVELRKWKLTRYTSAIPIPWSWCSNSGIRDFWTWQIFRIVIFVTYYICCLRWPLLPILCLRSWM